MITTRYKWKQTISCTQAGPATGRVYLQIWCFAPSPKYGSTPHIKVRVAGLDKGLHILFLHHTYLYLFIYSLLQKRPPILSDEYPLVYTLTTTLPKMTPILRIYYIERCIVTHWIDMNIERCMFIFQLYPGVYDMPLAAMCRSKKSTLAYGFGKKKSYPLWGHFKPLKWKVTPMT